MRPIVTLTANPTIDVNTTTHHVVPEAKTRCTAPRREPGGGGLNVSRAVQRLGGDSAAYYFAGGETGALLKSLLESEGLSHQPLDVADLTRENLIVYEESSGQQYRFGMPGPRVSEAECAKILEAMGAIEPAPDYLVASGSLPPGLRRDFYAEIARVGRARGSRVVVDTSGDALTAAAEAGVFLLKPNLRELCQLAGCQLEDEREIEKAACDIVERGGAEVVVVSLGAAGVYLATADHRERVRSPAVPIRSKVGAGDSTVGGIVLALLRGRPLPEAVRYGVAAGSAAVMTEGTELCRPEDTERIFQRLMEEAAGGPA